LSRYDVPERIVFVEALPKTSVGKLNKKMLREQYAQKRVKNSTKFLLFAAKWGASPDRAQDSDSHTSQDQESDIAQEGYGEKAESSTAQEAPVRIDSQKRSNPNAEPLSDHFWRIRARMSVPKGYSFAGSKEDDRISQTGVCCVPCGSQFSSKLWILEKKPHGKLPPYLISGGPEETVSSFLSAASFTNPLAAIFIL
jgi:hypothetical protein